MDYNGRQQNEGNEGYSSLDRPQFFEPGGEHQSNEESATARDQRRSRGRSQSLQMDYMNPSGPPQVDPRECARERFGDVGSIVHGKRWSHPSSVGTPNHQLNNSSSEATWDHCIRATHQFAENMFDHRLWAGPSASTLYEDETEKLRVVEESGEMPEEDVSGNLQRSRSPEKPTPNAHAENVDPILSAEQSVGTEEIESERQDSAETSAERGDSLSHENYQTNMVYNVMFDNGPFIHFGEPHASDSTPSFHLPSSPTGDNALTFTPSTWDEETEVISQNHGDESESRLSCNEDTQDVTPCDAGPTSANVGEAVPYASAQTQRCSFGDLLGDWLDYIGEQLMPDQALNAQQQSGPNENIRDAVEEILNTGSVVGTELEAESPVATSPPIRHLDSAISFLERNLCKQGPGSPPLKSPSTRRRRRNLAPRGLHDENRTRPSLRINTNLPDVNRFDSPSPSTWSGSGRSHFIDLSYSPEPGEHKDDPFNFAHSPAGTSAPSSGQFNPDSASKNNAHMIPPQGPDHAPDGTTEFFVMSARVPDLPCPEEFLTGPGSWSSATTHQSNEADPVILHPPDLHPSSVQADAPQDRFNEEFGNALEEGYNLYCIFTMMHVPPGVAISHNLRWSMTRLSPSRRSFFLERLWLLGLRGQYYIMLASGPLLFTSPPVVVMGEEMQPGVPAKSPKRLSQLTSDESSSSCATTPVERSGYGDRPARPRKIRFGGITAVSERPPDRRSFQNTSMSSNTVTQGVERAAVEMPSRPRRISFGGITAVSQRPPDPRKYAAAVATSTSTSTAFREGALERLEDIDEFALDD